MKQQLFRPFRWGQWLRFAIVGFLAGEMGSGGGIGGRFPGNFPVNFPTARISPLIVTGLIILGLVLTIVFLYISSRMRFVLFDGIVNGECRIAESWRRRGEPAFRYFVWNIVLALIGLTGFVIILGVPLLLAFAAGLFRNPGEHILLFVLCGSAVVLILFAWFLLLALIVVLTKDFVVPQMALQNLTPMDGWRRLWPMMKSEKGGYAGYIGMKILLGLAAGIILGIVSFAVLVILLIPVGGVGIVAVLGGRAAGFSWNPVTIALAIVAGLIVLAAMFFLLALISVPAIVFFPAYSLYFFADRYAPLGSLMNPAQPPILGTP